MKAYNISFMCFLAHQTTCAQSAWAWGENYQKGSFDTFPVVNFILCDWIYVLDRYFQLLRLISVKSRLNEHLRKTTKVPLLKLCSGITLMLCRKNIWILFISLCWGLVYVCQSSYGILFKISRFSEHMDWKSPFFAHGLQSNCLIGLIFM